MRAILFILTTVMFAPVFPAHAQYIEGDGFVFQDGEFYLTPSQGDYDGYSRRPFAGYGPPPDLAENVSPLVEEGFSPETGTGLGLDYFPPAPVSDEDKAVSQELAKIQVIPVPFPKPLHTTEVTVQETNTTLVKPTVENDLALTLPKTETKITVDTDTTKTTVERPVRIVVDEKQQAPSTWELQRPLEMESVRDDYWKILFIILLLLIIVLLLVLMVRGSPRQTSTETRLVTEPLTPDENQSLEKEVETAQAQAQARSDEMIAEAEGGAVSPTPNIHDADSITRTVKPKPKRKQALRRKTTRRRKTKDEWIADYKKLLESFNALRVFFSPWKEQKLLPSPETIPDHRNP